LFAAKEKTRLANVKLARFNMAATAYKSPWGRSHEIPNLTGGYGRRSLGLRHSGHRRPVGYLRAADISECFYFPSSGSGVFEKPPQPQQMYQRFGLLFWPLPTDGSVCRLHTRQINQNC
jgi:hypothetical protein